MTPRLYVATPLSYQQEITLDREQSHQLHQVLRLTLGNTLILFNDTGYQYSAVICAINNKQVTVRLGKGEQSASDATLATHLGQVISRGERMDYTIQKSVELGVSSITPLISERCGVKLSADRLNKRLAHWHKVMIHACQQCGRTRLATIHPPQKLTQWLVETATLKFFCDPHATSKLTDYHNTNNEEVSLLVGSEGGFTDSEQQTIQAANFLPLSLGPRVLRTETAAVVALSLIQQRWGDLQ